MTPVENKKLAASAPQTSAVNMRSHMPSQGNQGKFENIEQFETDLWEAADNLRANSKLTSSDYFMPVLGRNLPPSCREPLRRSTSSD